MKYKAIIFDMDGTIIKSEDLWTAAVKDLLISKGKATAQECDQILPQLKGSSVYTSCAFIKMNFQLSESIEELIRLKEAFVFKNFGTLVTFVDGFEQFHQQITALGIPTAIATNANLSSLEKITKHFPLNTFFKQHIYCIDHIGKKPKPLPDIYLHAAQQLDIDPIHCIAIEDSAHGIAAAKAAGMFCIGINSGNDRSTLTQADLIIDHYDEIDLKQLLVG